MAWLNSILWLRCRLMWRQYSRSRFAALGALTAISASWFSSVPFGFLIALLLLAQPEARQVELLHLVLASVWFMWISFPIMSHRVNESLDLSKLSIYPVPPRWLLLGSLLACLLDLSAFLVLPLLLSLALAAAGTVQGFCFNAAILFLLVAHTVAASQLCLFFLLSLMRSRKVVNLVVVLISAIVIAGVCGLEIHILSSQGEAGTVLDARYSDFLCYFPPGIAAEAMAAFRRGDLPWAFWNLGVMLAVAALTMVLTDYVIGKMVRGEYGGSRARRGARRRQRSSLVFPLLRRLLGSGQRAAMVLREALLLGREPQYRLMAVMYGIIVISIGSFGMRAMSEVETQTFFPFFLYSLLFMFAGPAFNSLSIERRGLAFLMTAPASPLAILVAKNLAFVAVLTGINGVAILAFSLGTGVAPAHGLACFLAFQVTVILMAGVGNLVSVLVPYRMPARGGVPRRFIGFGQVLLVTILSSLGMGLCLCFAAVGSSFFVLPLLLGAWPVLAFSLVPGLLFTAGVYCFFTFAAARLWETRKERLLPAVID